ncbi:MAG: tetratricopeptide repeat protein, partial [Bacteroidales bacterium]|nr:tetratricopeptide repeat protein [Bacteroidales bacterium]
SGGSSRKGNIPLIFRIILLSDKLKENEIRLLDKISKPGNLKWYDKSMLVSALTLSLIRHFDISKINLLFAFYEAGENQIWQKALTGLVLALAYYDNRIDYYPEVLQRLKATQGSPKSGKSVEFVIIQFIKARETEKITQKIRQEIIPEMIKIKSKLEEKLDLENLLSSSKLEQKNPEWETFFKESPDVYNKLEEFSNLQMEGADVFLGAFAMLKQFEFFREISNWFLPFYKENEYISSVFEDGGEGFDLQQLAQGIERSSFLCNSDKYSFCLNVKQMPSFQKSTVMELFNMELKAMNELSLDDELIHSASRDKTIITQYFQDLYRFYKLHPLRSEFDDVFKLSISLYDTRFFKLWINDINILRNIGEFLFEKDYYQDALQVFSQIVEKLQDYELFEKMAYCHQQLGDFAHALNYYHKAELYGRNKLWLLNRIAFCYRKKGEYENAVKYYLEAEKLEPENLEVQAFLGQTYMEMEDYEEALKYYFKVEYLQPDNFKVYRPISWCSFMLNKFEIARKYLAKSIQRNASKHDYMNMGHIFWCEDRKQEAIEYYILSLRTSNRDFEWFSKVLLDDSRYLTTKGVQQFDIALMIDYIKLSEKS